MCVSTKCVSALGFMKFHVILFMYVLLPFATSSANVLKFSSNAFQFRCSQVRLRTLRKQGRSSLKSCSASAGIWQLAIHTDLNPAWAGIRWQKTSMSHNKKHTSLWFYKTEWNRGASKMKCRKSLPSASWTPANWMLSDLEKIDNDRMTWDDLSHLAASPYHSSRIHRLVLFGFLDANRL